MEIKTGILGNSTQSWNCDIPSPCKSEWLIAWYIFKCLQSQTKRLGWSSSFSLGSDLRQIQEKQPPVKYIFNNHCKVCPFVMQADFIQYGCEKSLVMTSQQCTKAESYLMGNEKTTKTQEIRSSICKYLSISKYSGVFFVCFFFFNQFLNPGPYSSKVHNIFHYEVGRWFNNDFILTCTIHAGVSHQVIQTLITGLNLWLFLLSLTQ